MRICNSAFRHTMLVEKINEAILFCPVRDKIFWFMVFFTNIKTLTGLRTSAFRHTMLVEKKMLGLYVVPYGTQCW